MQSRRILAAGWAAVTLAAAGCGGTTGAVSGTVTYDGTPVEKGSITFLALDGKGPTTGGNIVDGHFAVKDVPVGPSKVVITGTQVIGEVPRYNTPNSPTKKKVKQFLPEKYSDLEKSELRYDVPSGSVEKNFELKQE